MITRTSKEKGKKEKKSCEWITRYLGPEVAMSNLSVVYMTGGDDMGSDAHQTRFVQPSKGFSMLTMATCATASRGEFVLNQGQPIERDHIAKESSRCKRGVLLSKPVDSTASCAVSQPKPGSRGVPACA